MSKYYIWYKEESYRGMSPSHFLWHLPYDTSHEAQEASEKIKFANEIYIYECENDTLTPVLYRWQSGEAWAKCDEKERQYHIDYSASNCL